MSDKHSPARHPFERVEPDGRGGWAGAYSEDTGRPYTTADLTNAMALRAQDKHEPFLKSLRPLHDPSRREHNNPQGPGGAQLPAEDIGVFGKTYRKMPWVADTAKDQGDAQSWRDAALITAHHTLNPFELVGGAVDTVQEAVRDPHNALNAVNAVALAPMGGKAMGGSLARDSGQLNSLIGPKGARRLAEAINPETGSPFRKAGEWGAIDQLPLAQEARAAGLDPWTKYGWSDNAFGRDHPWYSTIDDAPLKPNDRWGGKGKTLGEQINHPEFFAAYPDTAATRFDASTGSTFDHASGGTTIRNSSAEYQKQAGDAPYHVYVQAPDKNRTGINTVAHELQHIAQNEEQFPNGANTFDAGARYDTPAAAPFLPDALKAKELADQANRMSALDFDKKMAMRKEADKLDPGMREEPRWSAYWNVPGEINARGEQVVHGRNLDPRTPRQHEYLDTYDMSDIQGERYDKRNLKSFDVP